ncbi:MAG: HAD family hydrolase [Pedobacter sp.]|nr:MAG: HAD family hydrolase [Pedobacter sp.]
MKKDIAFFDFDGTITRKDTMIEFIRFAKGNRAYMIGLAMLSPWLAGMKAGVFSNEFAKEKMLGYFFKGMKLEEFDLLCGLFSEKLLPGLIRPDAMVAIGEHLSKGTEVIVVSASAENWVKQWATRNGLKYLCTKLVCTNGILTGKIDGLNCNGAEKVNRIKQVYDPADYENIYCYGDTSGDKEMLQLANHPFYRVFTQ